MAEIAARPGLGAYVAELDLAHQLDPTRYLGLSAQVVDRTLGAVRAARAAEKI